MDEEGNTIMATKEFFSRLTGNAIQNDIIKKKYLSNHRKNKKKNNPSNP